MDAEEELLRSVALRNAESVLAARREAEAELLRTRDALEERTAELQRSLAMMRATFESTTDAILVTDASGAILDFNQRLLDAFSIPGEVLALRAHGRLLDFIAQKAADPAAVKERVGEIYRSAASETADLLELADGRAFERTSRIQSVEGRNAGRVWCFHEITAQKRIEHALREETSVLEVLNDTGALLSSQLDIEGIVQAVTDATTRLSGARFGAFFYTVTKPDGGEFQLYTLSGAPREAFERFGHPRATALFGITFRGEGIVRIDDVRKDPRYGTMGPHHGMPPGHLPVRSYLAVPVASRAGAVLGGLFFGHPDPGIFTARSERIVAAVAAQASVAIDNARLYQEAKSAAAERAMLLEAERKARVEVEHVSLMKDEFLATLSHELRTPLNAVVGWSEILLAGQREPAEVRRGLETIARNARAQAQLIEDLLDMSRIVAGKVKLEVQRIGLAPVIEAAIDAVKLSVDAKQLALSKTIDADARVMGDPNRLQQIVWNLLSNAVKFTQHGGAVKLRVERSGARVEICVEDNGAGIEAGFLPHVFERFRQADGSTTRAHGGLGLGLAIVKQLVELHGGVVRAESEGRGRGARFVVSLPAAGASVRDRRPGHDAPLQQAFDLSGLAVLVVDDDADARLLAQWVLQSCRAEVRLAASGAEALALIARRAPDVLVSDLGMPEMDGYQLIRAVRALPGSAGGAVPAVALTAFARPEDRTRALLAGFQLHLAKPVEPDDLVAAIASLAGRKPRSGDRLAR